MMRKQYHSRSSERGNLIWDVDRLVLLTKDLPRVEIPLTAIRELDEPFWFNAGDPPATCRAVIEHARLINAVDLSYPIIPLGGRPRRGWHASRGESAAAGTVVD
jgi:hypothetical protein